MCKTQKSEYADVAFGRLSEIRRKIDKYLRYTFHPAYIPFFGFFFIYCMDL